MSGCRFRRYIDGLGVGSEHSHIALIAHAIGCLFLPASPPLHESRSRIDHTHTDTHTQTHTHAHHPECRAYKVRADTFSNLHSAAGAPLLFGSSTSTSTLDCANWNTTAIWCLHRPALKTIIMAVRVRVDVCVCGCVSECLSCRLQRQRPNNVTERKFTLTLCGRVFDLHVSQHHRHGRPSLMPFTRSSFTSVHNQLCGPVTSTRTPHRKLDAIQFVHCRPCWFFLFMSVHSKEMLQFEHGPFKYVCSSTCSIFARHQLMRIPNPMCTSLD